MKRILFTFIALMCLDVAQLFAQSAGRENFDLHWMFHLGDVPDAEKPGFPDHDWRRLDLPHDWSIEGSFRPDILQLPKEAPSPEELAGTGKRSRFRELSH